MAARAASFGTVARDYDRLRARPPGDALPWLLPPEARQILELGAGTGLLTMALAQRAPRVIAVEPDERMRAVLAEKARRGRGDAVVDVVGARAEEIPLPAASVDVVIAQSAWHWVDEQRGVPEVARVLRPGGRFALAWTGTDRSVDWMRTLWAGGTEHRAAGRTESDGRLPARYEVHLDAGGRNDFTDPETAHFRWTQPMARADLVALAGTYSAVIAMDAEDRRRHLAGMARYLDSLGHLSERDVIDVPMRSYCWRTTRH